MYTHEAQYYFFTANIPTNTMKRIHNSTYIAAFALAAFSFLLIPLVFAQQTEDVATSSAADTPAQPENRPPQAQEQGQNGRENAREQQGTRQPALGQRTQNRIINLTNNVGELMEAGVARLEHITDRMRSRIAKLDAEGVETEEALRLVDESADSLNIAKTALGSMGTLVERTVTSENPHQDFREVRSRFNITRQALHQSRDQLRAALSTLKRAVRSSEESAGVSEAVSDESAADENE